MITAAPGQTGLRAGAAIDTEGGSMMGSTARRTARRLAATGGLAALGLIVVAGAASAHVDPTPAAAQVGTTATIGFGIEHGCGTSPTTGVALRVPDGVTNVKAVDKAGWTSTVSGNEIRFTGGSLDAKTPDHFDLTMTMPTTPGMISVPVVQTCTEGSLSWIEIPVEGQAEPEYPAPQIKLTAGVPTAEDLAPPVDDAEAGHSHDDSNTGVIVGGSIAAVVIVGGAAVVIVRRRGRSSAA
jgi:uncharacterized protein YcnI